MKGSIDEHLLQRYVEQRCTPEEESRVEEWLTKPVNEKVLKNFMLLHWNNLQDSRSVPMMGHLLEKIHTQIAPSSQQEKRSTAFLPSFYQHRQLIGIAASLVLLVLVFGALYLNKLTTTSLPVTTSWKIATSKAGSGHPIKTLRLPDGTQVWLNAQSTLRFPEAFAKGKREVFLDGEAYFDVTENKESPFIVYTNHIQVKVLGTAFTVKSYGDDATSETTLLRGKVNVKSTHDAAGEAVELKPNQRMVYQRSGQQLRLSSVAASDYMLWKEGVLLFDEETIENVVNTLERWYGVTIHVPPGQDMSCQLNARIEKESLTEMLDLLQSVTKTTYSVKGKHIYLQGSICN